MTFKELNLIEPIMHAVAEKGYVTPTPIQEQAIPPALEAVSYKHLRAHETLRQLE